MNKSKALMMALLAFAFAAHAAPVSESDAKLAARAWVARGGMLGASMGRNVEKIASHSTTNGSVFYTVKMNGLGTLVMSADTRFPPVIAFTQSKSDFSEIDPLSPLWSLLNRDVSSLTAAMRLVDSAKASEKLSRKMSSVEQAGVKLWGELLAEGRAIAANASAMKFEDPIMSGQPGDLRVGTLLKTKWGQGTSHGNACWNYYTPNGSDPDEFVPGNSGNAVCGCVATAMAQIMRYHNYPVQELTPLERTCYWGDEEIEIKLTTAGGFYNWDAMTYDPDGEGTLEPENYQAMGKLTSDAGISVYMMYTESGSGAYSFDISGAMKNYWRYGSASYLGLLEEPYFIDETVIGSISRQAMYSNFDAGLPVFMGIPGHQIVADGYGWNGEYEFVHLNMGWVGQCDYWYNLPDMTEANYMFDVVDDLVYNVIPYGRFSSAVISGRTLDEDGGPMAGAVVGFYNADTGALVTQVVSSASGVWGAVVSSGTYDISAVSADGYMLGEKQDVAVAAPRTTSVTWNGMRTVPTVTSAGDIGNSWGNDITLVNPSVRVGAEVFSRLDKALAAAAEIASPVIEILQPTELKESAEIGFSCTITATNLADAAATPVRCADGAALVVASGARVLFENVVFSGDNVSFEVLEGGRAALSGVVGIDELVTADAGGIELAGVLESAIVVDCAAAKDANQVFGSISAAGAQSSASKLFNKYDDELGGVAQGESLAWGAAEVDDVSAIVKLVQDGETVNYRSIGTLMKFVTNAAEMVVVKNCTLAEDVSIVKDMLVRSENGATIDVVDAATVAVKADMVVSNVTFDCSGSVFDASFMTVESGAALTLDDGAVLEGGKMTGSGAVYVEKGATLTMLDGSAVRNFTGEKVFGGAVSLVGEFRFEGGTISGNRAMSGGGVYAVSGSKIYVSGSAKAANNRRYAPSGDSNIELCSGDILALEDGAGLLNIGVTYSRSDVGTVFGLAPGLADAAISHTNVFCDANGGVIAEISDEKLVWAEIPVEPVYVARIGDEGYESFSEAVENAEDGDVVEIIWYDAYLDADVKIDKDITLTSTNEAFSLSRKTDCCIEIAQGGSLTVTNIVIDGGSSYGVLSDWTLIYVNGGKLVLGENATIIGAEASTFAASAVVAYNAVVEMHEGSKIKYCGNFSEDGMAGGLLVSGESAFLDFNGGIVKYCACVSPENPGGGVSLLSSASMSVRGDGSISENYGGNLFVADTADLSLSSDFSGIISLTNGLNASTKEFGVVAEDYDGTNLAASAACFVNEADATDLGVVVTNAAKRILVWASALTDAGDGTWVYVTDDGETLALYGEIPTVPGAVQPVDIAFRSVVYDSASGSWMLSVTNAVKSCWYTLYGVDDLGSDKDFEMIERKRAEEDGEIQFSHQTNAPSFFWGVVAEPSDAHENE